MSIFKKEEIFQINNLTFYLKKLEKSSKVNLNQRKKKIIKIGVKD